MPSQYPNDQGRQSTTGLRWLWWHITSWTTDENPGTLGQLNMLAIMFILGLVFGPPLINYLCKFV